MAQLSRRTRRKPSDGLVVPGMTVDAYRQLIFPDPFGHPLAGPVYVEGAESGDILAVTLHQIELEDWAGPILTLIGAYLGDELDELHLKTYIFGEDAMHARFSDNIVIPLQALPWRDGRSS